MTEKIPYLSLSDAHFESLPEGTRITAEAIPGSGTWWIATGDKDPIDVDNGNRRFLAIDPAWGADVQSWVEGIELEDGKLQFTNCGTGERKTLSYYHRLMEERLAKSEPHQPMFISAPTGKAAKTIHSMLYGKEGGVTGRTGHVIIDECDPPLSPNSLAYWSDRLWPTDYADIELRLLALTTTVDTWRDLYMCDWSDHKPEPTEKEKKAAHRETYLRHNKIKGKHRDPHARRARPY
ncbi:hypothetical protein [Sphingobium sp. MK2]|uniref:hypothetical protein n=1 Tax=Sphingobium sp. MK2 TaxID=3116540 RepID=UPI0032E35AC5